MARVDFAVDDFFADDFFADFFAGGDFVSDDFAEVFTDDFDFADLVGAGFAGRAADAGGDFAGALSRSFTSAASFA